MIDLMKDVIYTEAQLNKHKDRLITSGLPLGGELNVSRGYSVRNESTPPTTPPGLKDSSTKYIDCLDLVDAEMVKMTSDNDLLIRTLDYEKAVFRLDKYVLSKGRPPLPVYKLVIDQGTGDEQQVLDYTVAAIEPLSPTVLVSEYDESGDYLGKIDTPNPLVVADERERTEAKIIVDNASQDTLDTAVLRGNI